MAPLLLGLPLLLLIVVALVSLVFATSGSNLFGELREDTTRQAIFLSLRTTLISLLVVCVFGTGVALVVYRGPAWLSGPIELLVTLPAIMPPSVAGIALLLAFGRQGLLGPLLQDLGVRIAFTEIAVILAQVFVSTPFFVRALAGGLASVDQNLVEAAAIDGAKPRKAVTSILLPLSAASFVGGAALAWARAVGEFGATILFAGNMVGRTQTMPLAIYLGFESDLEKAKALSVLLLALAALVLVVSRLAYRGRISS